MAKLFAIVDDARQLRRITGAELAAASDMHEVTYSRLRRNPAGLKSEILQKLIDGLVKLDAISSEEREILAARIREAL